MPLIATVHRFRSETIGYHQWRSDLTVEYLDTSLEVERYLDPSTIRSLSNLDNLWVQLTAVSECEQHQWRASTAQAWNNTCTCEHITRGATPINCSWPHTLSTGGLFLFESACVALRLINVALIQLVSFTCNEFNHVHLMHAPLCMCHCSRAQHSLCSRTVVHTTIAMYLVVLLQTCCSIPT